MISNNKHLKSKRAMMWYIEFAISIVIFFLALTIYFQYRNNIVNEQTNNIEELVTNAKLMSNAFMGSGSPDNWTKNTVSIIGLTNNNYRINFTKLNMFQEINKTKVRNKFKVYSKYYLYFEKKDGNIIPINGDNGIGDEPINETDIVSVTRIVIYNHTLTKMILDVWN